MEVQVRLLTAAALTVALVLPASPAAGQGNTQGMLAGIVVAERQDSDENKEFLISAPASINGRGVDEIRVKLDGNVARRLVVAYIPQGWSSKADKDRLTLTGPTVVTTLVAVRYQAVNIKLPTKVEIEIKSGGQRVYQAETPMGRLPQATLQTSIDTLLVLPQRIVRGDAVMFSPLSQTMTPVGGEWTVAGEPAKWNKDFLKPRYTFTSSLSLKLPFGVRYKDPWGVTLVDTQVDDVVLANPGLGTSASMKPAITGCSPKTLVGKSICVCGSFPTAESRSAISMNGMPLSDYLVSSSSAVLNFKLPADFKPGPLGLMGQAGAGYGPSDKASSQLIGVGGDVDRNKLLKGESTPLRLWLVGTDEPLSLRLWNTTPGIISLEGGNDQVVTTAGGATNEVVKTVRGISPGDFVLNYSLTLSCPCAREGPALPGLAKEGPEVGWLINRP